MDKELFRHMFENEVKAKFGDDASFASYDYVHHRNYRDLRVGGRMLGADLRASASYTLLLTT